jgi:hypothetical protein
MALQPPSGPRPLHYQGFMITLRHTTLGRTPLDERSAHCRDLFLKHAALTRDKHPCLLWDSNPKSQQVSCRRPMPYIVRPLGSAIEIYSTLNV